MRDQDILGMKSASEHAKECDYGSNMFISAALVVEMADRIAELELKQRDIIRDIKVCFGYAVACDGNLLVNADAYNLLVATCNAKIKEQGDD